MSPEQVIDFIRSRGGRLYIEGSLLIVEPDTAGLPVIEQLRAAKPEIVAMLQGEAVTERDVLPGGWLLDRCAYRDRCFGGVGGLHLDLARWCAEHGQPVPASRRAFETALQAEGFAVTTDGLVYGLLLREDVEAALLPQTAPQASVTPARATGTNRRNVGRRNP